MKLTIEISDNYIEELKKPVSVQRILNNAINVAEMAVGTKDKDEDRMQYVLDELRPMIAALSHVAYIVRNAIWEKLNESK